MIDFILDPTVSEDYLRAQDQMLQTIFCPNNLEDFLNLEPDDIVRKLSSWLNSQELKGFRQQTFLAGLPKIEDIYDIFEYASICCFKEITGFVEYLSKHCN